MYGLSSSVDALAANSILDHVPKELIQRDVLERQRLD